MGNDQKHEGCSGRAENARAHLAVTGYVFRPREILRDLHQIVDGHSGLFEHEEDMLPCEFGLAGADL